MLHTSTKRDFAYWILTFLTNWFTSRSHLYILCKKIKRFHCLTEWMLSGLSFFSTLYLSTELANLWVEKDTHLTHQCSKQPNSAWQTILWNLSSKNIAGKIFEGEVLIRTLPPTLLKLFCKIIFNSKVIVNGLKDTDHNF